MKRRVFLKGLVGTPAVVAVTKLEPAIAAIEPTPQEPILYDYGNSGILRIVVVTDQRKKYRATVIDPQWDWNEGRPIKRKFEMPEFTSYPWSPENRPCPDPFSFVVPVNELSIVEFYEDDVLIHTDKPVWDPTLELFSGFGAPVKGGFEEWRFHSHFAAGVFNGRELRQVSI